MIPTVMVTATAHRPVCNHRLDNNRDAWSVGAHDRSMRHPEELCLTHWPSRWHCVGLYARVRQGPHRLRPRRRGVIPTKTPLLPHQFRSSSLFPPMSGGRDWLWSISTRTFSRSLTSCQLSASCSWHVPIYCVPHVWSGAFVGHLLSRYASRICLSFHIRCAHSDFVILNNLFSPVPFPFVYTARPQPS